MDSKRIHKKKRKYHIIHTNCDCAAGTIARTTTRWMYGPRCPSCGTILGPMSWSVLDEVMANGQFEAMLLYRESRQTSK